MWINAGGERFWVKYHFKTDQGNEFLSNDEAPPSPRPTPTRTSATSTRPSAGERSPSWSLSVQIMPFDDAAEYRFNPFDLTKVWPHADYPLIPVGRMVLDRNPGQLLRRDRAGDVRALEHGAGHRPVTRQDAPRPAFQLPRHPPAPGRAPTPTSSRSTVPGHRCTPTTATGRCATRTHPTPSTPRTPTVGPGAARALREQTPRGRSTASSCAPPTSCTPKTTTSARPAPWYATFSMTQPRDAWSPSSRTSAPESSSPCSLESSLLAPSGQGHRRPHRRGRPAAGAEDTREDLSFRFAPPGGQHPVRPGEVAGVAIGVALE